MNILSTKFDDTRPNIATDELSDAAQPLEAGLKHAVYTRNRALDPQLVWRGKETTDEADLEVPTVPIYIQEEVKPRDIVESLRRDAQAATGVNVSELPGLFDTSDVLPLDKKIEICQHEEPWRNRMILGDSLLVMNSLAEQEGFKGKVQTIIFDPPYGIKFGSNWQASTRSRTVSDGKETDVSREPEVIKAFRDTWELGVHSYLSYWRDRLSLGKAMLTETGSVFVQIGDENVHLVRSLMDEVFGRENLCSQITFLKTSGQSDLLLTTSCDYLLWYANNKKNVKYNQLFSTKGVGDEGASEYRLGMSEDGSHRTLSSSEIEGREPIASDIRVFRPSPTTSQGWSEEGSKPFTFRGVEYKIPANAHWKTTVRGMERLGRADRLLPRDKSVSYVRFINDLGVTPIANYWGDTKWGFDAKDKTYVVQTNTKVFERCVLMTSDPGDLVLDPTCGSGTTAYVAEQWGRRWITIDSSRVALALARTRLMTAKFPAYLLADSEAGRKKEAELTGKPLPTTAAPPMNDIRRGYVTKRVPRVTLKSIANNDEIDTIDAKHAPILETLLAAANAALGATYKPWELPRVAPTPQVIAAPAPDTAAVALASYWAAWRQRKQEMDASIARRAETVYLVDKPYEDNKAVRVAGAFTVESLSPHRIIAPVEDEYRDGVTGTLAAAPDDVTTASDAPFEAMILAHLLKAGVQNTKKGERLEFEELEAYGGSPHIQGAGIQKETGTLVAVTIGARYGTVTKELVNEAVKANLRGRFGILLVCGFAFDPAVHDEAESLTSDEYVVKKFGRTSVLFVRINHDLMVGAGYLKNTGAGNLFTVFGEPDIVLTPVDAKARRAAEPEYTVTIRGVDIFNPQTSEAKSYDTKDIACWFVDTNYDGEHFVVRHAYFTGGNRTYEGLAKTLRGDLNEAAWDALYSNISRPFVSPETGRIAVKVINHYGDEVLRVYRLPEDLARFTK